MVWARVSAEASTANQSMLRAQEMTRSAEAAVRENEGLADKLGKERLAFSEEKARHDAEWATMSRGVEDAQRMLAEKEKNLKLFEDKIDADMSAVRDREAAVVHDRKMMDEREKALAAREFKLAETLKDLGPIAQKLGLNG